MGKSETLWDKYHRFRELGEPQRALDCLEAAARRGKLEVAFLLGQEYGVFASAEVVDYARAAEWFRFAADRGHAPAKYEYGLALVLGLGVEPDAAVGMEYIHAAARLDNAFALRWLLDADHQARHGFVLTERDRDRYGERLLELKRTGAA